MIRLLRRQYPILALCAGAGLLAALVVLAVDRLPVERANRTVELTVDGDDWATLARRYGMDRDALYAELYHRGVRSVTLYAASLRRLADAGLVTFAPGADLLNAARTGPLAGPLADLVRAGRVRPNATYVVGDLPLLRLVQAGFAARLGDAHTVLLQGSGPVLEIAGRGRELEDASLGVVPAEIDAARAHGLTTELRVRNFSAPTADRLEAFLANLVQAQEPFTVIFDRDQVLGYDQMIPDVADGMKRAGFAFGWIESLTERRRQKGDESLVQLMKPDVIRVFSLVPEELAGMTPDDARDKFVLAARERNDRILYVRPFLGTPILGTPGADEIQANLDYVGSIAQALEGAGYRMGKARPLPATAPPAPLFAVMALGALAATAIATGEVSTALARPVSRRTLWWGVGAGLLLTGAMIAVHHVTLWRQILAFFAALAFPTLSMLWLLPGARRETDQPPRARFETPGGLHLLARSIAGLWAVSAVSALGGVMVAALLSEWEFMMEARAFLGVKPAHVIPVLTIGLLLAAAQEPSGRLWPRLRAWLRQPLLLEYGIAIIAVGVVTVFALGRTGNLGLPALGGLEVKSRLLLQHLLVARPRTKEYLVGHPFLVLTFALAALGMRRWVLPAAVVGAIGQVGLVNSFSHIHTPLVYIVLRTVYALVLGSMLGAVLVGLLLWGRRRWSPPAA
jgi:hypothetical protein